MSKIKRTHILKVLGFATLVQMSILSFALNNRYLNAEPATERFIIDSDLTFEESIRGTTAPKSIIEKLVLVDVYYYSTDKKLHKGQLVINKQVKDDIIAIFEHIKTIKFPVEKVVPIVKYNWSDSASMAANNTSSFNYRKVAGTNKLSNHATGRAIDINPMQNPYKVKKYISPKGAKYDTTAPGTLLKTSTITKLFLNKKWKWGGNYKNIKDWQHFDKKK